MLARFVWYGRLGTRVARLGSLQIASPAYAAVTSVPTAYNGRLGRGGTPCRPRTTDALVGAALRADRIPTNLGVAQLASHSPLYPNSRMRPIFFISCGVFRSGHAGGVPLPANPSVGAALRAVRPTTRPHTTDASERRPYQHHARLAFTLHKQKPAAFLPRACFSYANFSGQALSADQNSSSAIPDCRAILFNTPVFISVLRP